MGKYGRRRLRGFSARESKHACSFRGLLMYSFEEILFGVCLAIQSVHLINFVLKAAQLDNFIELLS